MAEYAPPKRGVAYITYIDLVDQSNPLVFKTNPTIASGDWKISKDGGAYANLATLPVVEPAGSSTVKIALSGIEMDGDNVHLVGADATGAEWASVGIHIHPVSDQNADLAAAIATVDTVVDAVKVVTDALTAASAAKLAASAGTIVTGAAVAGTLSITQMTTNLTEATDDHLNGRVLIWTSGALTAQATAITDYDGTSKMLTFTAVTEAPSADDAFVIV